MTVPETRDLTVVGVSHLRALTWPITATVTRVTCEPARIILDHSKAGRWPVVNDDGTALEGCLWAIVHVGGRWCAGTIDYLRPGQIEKHIPPAEYVARWKAAGLETRVPASGELVGVFVSTLARQGQRSPVDERSQIVWTRVGTSDIVAREPLVADPVPVPAPPSLPEHPDMAKPYPSEQWLIDVIGADLHEWAQARGFVGDLAHGSYLGSRAAARILQDYHGENLSLEASIAKHRPALREELGLDPR